MAKKTRTMKPDKPKKTCYVCKVGRPVAMSSMYVHAAGFPVFCSRRCAAEYGLLRAGIGGPGDLHWCDDHGWFVGCEAGYEATAGCPVCAMQSIGPDAE